MVVSASMAGRKKTIKYHPKVAFTTQLSTLTHGCLKEWFTVLFKTELPQFRSGVLKELIERLSVIKNRSFTHVDESMQGITTDCLKGLSPSQRSDWKIIFQAKTSTVKQITVAVVASGVMHLDRPGNEPRDEHLRAGGIGN